MYRKKWINKALSILLSTAMVVGPSYIAPANAAENSTPIAEVEVKPTETTETESTQPIETDSETSQDSSSSKETTESSSEVESSTPIAEVEVKPTETTETESTQPIETDSETSQDSSSSKETTESSSENESSSETENNTDENTEPTTKTENDPTEESTTTQIESNSTKTEAPSKEHTSTEDELVPDTSMNTIFKSDADNSIDMFALEQNEQGIYKFDFGGKGATQGFTTITNQLYDKTTGYGFTKTVTFKNDKGTNLPGTTSPIDENTFNACKDYTYTEDSDGLEFQVDVPAGTYQVDVYAGLGGSGHTPDIKVNQSSLGTASTAKPSDETQLKKTTKITLKEAGSIVISSTGSTGRNMLNALIIEQFPESSFQAPQNLDQVSDISSVILSWDKVTDADHYTIFRSSNGQNGDFLQIGTTTDTAYTDSVLTTKEYYYYVIAVGSPEGEITVSDPSEIVKCDVKSDKPVGKETNAEEYSNRALVAAKGDNGIFVSWRLYESDSDSISFTLNRNGTEVYSGGKTNYLDPEGKPGDVYTLTASEGLSGESATAWEREYQEFTLKAPDPQTMPNGEVAIYKSNDLSVADLDGDGELELIVKWYPSNAQDNSKDGYTGTTILDAYDIDTSTGEAILMWRIDLGLNIRSGAHYVQFQVWDYDGDGKAELICKTADGSTTFNGNLQETGHVGAVSVADLPTDKKDSPYDYRQHTGRIGRIVLGNEYLTVFDGETGEIIDSANYVPFRGTYDETTGKWDTTHWGLKDGAVAEKNDGYANRADRFLCATAYLDGGSPSAVFCRGYYGRTALTAWKLVNGKLVMQWAFDVPDGDKFSAQGNHGLSVNDVDEDGYDEIIYGSLVVDHDGTPLYTTGLGHGDAMHVSDWNGDGKLEIFQVHEEADAKYHAELHDAKTGEIIWGYNNGADTGRGVAADIDPRYPGAEMWYAVAFRTLDVNGDQIYPDGIKPSQNFSIFWDGDLLMELFDSNNPTQLVPQIQKWDYENMTLDVIAELEGTQLNNGTKGNAGLVADILGDWREEVLVRDTNDNNKLRLYTTTIETEYRLPTFLEDRAYREGVAWQNIGYNQPSNVTYLLTEGLKTSEIEIGERTTSTISLTWTAANDGTYGHPITGYQILRAICTDGVAGEYQKVGEVGADVLSFTDTALSSNTEYSYKIVSMVDGKKSHSSLSASTKTTIAMAGVQPFDTLELVQDSKDYLTKFPTTATVVDESGKEQIVDITWELQNFHISDAGTVTVYGSIYGRSEKVPLTVVIKNNIVISNPSLDDIYTLIGQEPKLPETIMLTFLNGDKKEVAVNWERNFDLQTVGEYSITGTATTLYGETISIPLKLYVKADYIVSIEKPAAVSMDFGTDISDASSMLPKMVKGVWASDGRTEEVAVVWDKIDTEKVGAFIINGRIENYAPFAEIEVMIDYPVLWKFDFGIEGSKVADGWTGITVNKQGGTKTVADLGIDYTKEKAYGFIDWEGKGIIEGRSQNYSKDGAYSPDVYTDLALASTSTQENTFVVDVENGEYVVEMMSGSTDKSTVKANIEGKAYSVGNAAKTYEVGRFENILVTDGQLTMTFTSGNYSRLNAIVVRKVLEGKSESQDANQKILDGLALLPENGEKLSPYDVQKIDFLAKMISEMTEEEKSSLTKDVLEKLDTFYQKAHNLELEISVSAKDTIDPAKVLSPENISIIGAFTASAADEGTIALEIVQQNSMKDDEKVQIEFKVNLMVNGFIEKLHAPVIFSIKLPSNVSTKNLVIYHYDDNGVLIESLTPSDVLEKGHYTINGNIITVYTNGFSVFSFVADKDSESNDPNTPDDSNNSNSSSHSSSSSKSSNSSAAWIKDTNGWRYHYASGEYASAKWAQINGKWYYFDIAGYSQTGWMNFNPIWYYLKADGSMAANEWILADDQWYYLNINGSLAIDWLLDNGTWYYLNKDGSMKTGWLLDKDNWYYLNSDGSMATGWIMDNGNWYYLNADGSMAANTTTPDGYQVNADGVLVSNVK